MGARFLFPRINFSDKNNKGVKAGKNTNVEKSNTEKAMNAGKKGSDWEGEPDGTDNGIQSFPL